MRNYALSSAPADALQLPAVRDLRRILPRRRGYQRRDVERIAGVVIHHTSGAHLDWNAEAIARYHVEVLGWPGIGYHFIVHWSGVVDWCNDLESVAYHADGEIRINGVGLNNWQHVGVCLTGDFVQGRTPTLWQLLSARLLIDRLSWTLGRRLPVLGHSELSPMLCPGDQWAEWGKELR